MDPAGRHILLYGNDAYHTTIPLRLSMDLSISTLHLAIDCISIPLKEGIIEGKCPATLTLLTNSVILSSNGLIPKANLVASPRYGMENVVDVHDDAQKVDMREGARHEYRLGIEFATH